MALQYTDLDDTVAGDSANTYIDETYADAFLEKHLWFWATWDAMSENDQTARILAAAEAIDNLPLDSIKATEDQAMMFPLYSQIGDTRDPSTSIPEKVKKAQCHMIMALYNFQDSSTGQASRDVDKMSVAGAVSFEFSRAVTSNTSRLTGGNFDTVLMLLSKWLTNETRITVTGPRG